MKVIKSDILIIGAGLTGLTLAYFLRKLDVSVKIVEAQNRIGGRIYTKYNTDKAPIELGATWLVEQQTQVLALLKELNINVFEQYYSATAIYEPNPSQAPQLVNLPANNAASYRISQGSQSLIKTLSEKIPEVDITLNTIIKKIEETDSGILAKAEHQSFSAKHIISTLPPFLFFRNIITTPSLPNTFKDIASKTHTWMGDSIRVGFTYKNAFWQNSKTSGTIYSNKGPLQEFYDHSNVENSLHALSGFMNSSFYKLSKDERKNQALKQLVSYYGQKALAYENYEECVWKDQPYTTTEYDGFIMPQQNNGHLTYQEPYLNNRLFIAGTETSTIFSGKMEGAITSARSVFEQLKPFL